MASALLLTMSVTIPASAKSTNDLKTKVIFKAEEIKDLKTIEEKAKKGITDDKNAVFNINFKQSLKVEKEEKTDTKPDAKLLYATSQKLSEAKDIDGSITESYVATGFVATAASGSLTGYDEAWDSTIAAKVAIKVYYNHKSYTEGGKDYDLYEFTDVNGQVAYKSGVSVTSMELLSKGYGRAYLYGSTSNPLGTKSYDRGTTTYSYPTTGTWYSASGGQTDYYYDCADTFAYCASKVRLNLYYRSSSWTVEVDFIKGNIDWVGEI